MPNQPDIELALGLFREQRNKLAEVRKLDYKHPDFKFWRDTTTNLFQRFVSPDSSHFIRFRDIRFLSQASLPVRPLSFGYRGPVPRVDAVSPEQKAQFERGCSEAENCIQGAIDEISMFGLHTGAPNTKSSKKKGGVQRDLAERFVDAADVEVLTEGNPVIELLCSHFHEVVKQLRKRHDGRATLDVVDEYDVQDLLHALLRIFFDDVRAEEWTPSYAGKSARMDFLLLTERTVMEAKRTRPGLGTKEIGDELIVDIARYQGHANCKKLICFVYDPESRIANPRGIENDLSRRHNGLEVKVIIAP